jgi:hypothetical protein
MSIKTTRTTFCDRCKGEVEDNHWEYRIGKLKWKCYKKTHIGRLSWMKLRNGSGSQNSNMSLDLCASCTETFLFFMENK